jgi:hypothetical protein
MELYSEPSTGRERSHSHECRHWGPAVVDPADEHGCYRVRCLLCGTVGPEGATSTEALLTLRNAAL